MIYINFSPEGYFLNVSTEATIVNGQKPVGYTGATLAEFSEQLETGAYVLKQGCVEYLKRPTPFHIFSAETGDWEPDKRAIDRNKSELLSRFYFSPKVTFFQVDQKSLGLIAGKALKLTRKQIAGSPLPSVEWRTTDNQVVEFTGEEFLSFADAAEEYAESVYKQVWAKKDAV